MMQQTNYHQLLKNLEYLKLKQMVTHLDEVIDFGIHNQLSFIDTLIKLTNYEIDLREKKHASRNGKSRGIPKFKRGKGF